jgi:peptidoglycan L-alanyl-D-glutamate endopeptidase CwlK
MDLLKINRDINLLAPFVQEKLAKALAECHDQGLEVYLFEGFRTPDRQEELYAAGRTKAGPKVTNARAWESWHQHGLAVDTAFKIRGRWSWEGAWDKVAAVFSYYSFKSLSWERPHFEITGGLTTEEALQYSIAHGLQSLWALVEEKIS